MVRKVLRFIRETRADADAAPDNEYNRGYHDALDNVEDYTLGLMWEEGIDDEEG